MRGFPERGAPTCSIPGNHLRLCRIEVELRPRTCNWRIATERQKPSESGSTVVVTGAGGLLGRATVDRFTRSGWSVIALDHAQLDITNEDAVRAALESAGPDLIVNCAATTDVDRCEREPDWAYAANEAGPRFLAQGARRLGAEIVHVSTDYVFDGEKDGLYTQDDKPNPLSVYASSKLAGERAVAAETDRHYIARSSWVFGAGGKNFGSRVIEYARGGARLKGVMDQESIPTYAPDLAARIEVLAGLKDYGLYHVTNTGPTTWYDFARLALDLAGMGDFHIEPATRKDLKQAAARPRNSAMRCLKSEAMGLDPLRHWRDAMPEFVGSVT
ncbi:MAG TPA: dTDP-4-dehydrorhamnose reductase [Blastocatellia bacterium]